MSSNEGSNVYTLALVQAGVGTSSLPERTVDRVDSLNAILSCLEYFQSEAVRLKASMGAHMLGAAVESLREEIARANCGETGTGA